LECFDRVSWYRKSSCTCPRGDGQYAPARHLFCQMGAWDYQQAGETAVFVNVRMVDYWLVAVDLQLDIWGRQLPGPASAAPSPQTVHALRIAVDHELGHGLNGAPLSDLAGFAVR
jgi:hypothetical protein